MSTNQDPQISVPDKPAEDPPGRDKRLFLRPGATLVDITGDELQIIFANYTVTFSSPPVTKGIHAIIEVLHSGAERAEVIRQASRKAELESELIAYLLEQLEATDCVYADIAGGKSQVELDLLADFYAYLNGEPAETLAALAAAPLLVITPASTQIGLEEVLKVSGLTAEIIGIAPGSSCGPVLDKVKEMLSPATKMLVSWNFPYRLPFARFLNDIALESKTPILFGACAGVVGRIGPYVFPSNTSCLECCNNRFLSQAGKLEMQSFSHYRKKYEDMIPAPWPVHPAFHDALLRIFVIEISQIVLNQPPRTMGGLLEYGYGDQRVQRHPVHKVPRCIACGPDLPERIAWDVQFPAPVVKDRV